MNGRALTAVEYLNSPYEQLKVRAELLELQSVMDRYKVRGAKELDSRLRDAENTKAAMRRMFDEKKRIAVETISNKING